MPVFSVGENVPDVIEPISVPSGSRTSMPGRGMPRPVAFSPRSRRLGPASFSARNAESPKKASFFQPTAQPSRAWTGEISAEMSWPWSG